MSKDRTGARVRVMGGMQEFVGKTGVVMRKEDRLYRVRLDEPVFVEGVGSVTDDLWESSMLKPVRR